MQLKVEDLRIGNVLFYGDRIAEVSSVYRTHFVCEESKTRVVFGNSIQNNFQPIPITEEWLIKFGFTFTNGYDEKGLSYKSFYKFTKVDGFTKGVSGMLNIKSIINPVSISTHSHIQYVHQLQNLYFSLTNEELICN